MEEIKMYLELLRPETHMMGAEIANVCLPADHASAIADLLEGLAAKLNDASERIHTNKALNRQIEEELKQEKKAASDLREENKILWSALNLATGRVRELWEGAK